ncbi:putative DNA-binding response regulator [Planococcus sp. PAMC 21323]|uniref:response regulator transcription factor n=1 Tax=Planococcus sp. PAMC 21323 TaxID=1526927 RepID=UPI000570D44C|nr:response regulator transcription factor [Planococcus sp. PAMC 21323]AIY06779.1 putative DNA-binding response regulator [Planococcus sp. PAMC 21323]
MIRILAVDDDIHMLSFIAAELRQAGYEVVEATSGEEALDILEDEIMDLAVVDVMMPGIDGFELTRIVRTEYDLPVILLTARHHIEDKERGFLAGSDDYLVKPFEAKELLYRVKAILRRYDHPEDDLLVIGSVSIDLKSYEVKSPNGILFIPLKEFELLALMASKPRQVLSRDLIIENVWGIDFQGDEQTINVHVKRLRQRLERFAPDVKIVTVRGVGYKLEVVT